MSIRFPKSCRTKTQRSAHARRVAEIRWKRVREARPPSETNIGYIEFGGGLAAGKPMRLELIARTGKRKLEGKSDGVYIGDFSERRILLLVKTIIRRQYA
jgi:hypothetical protein